MLGGVIVDDRLDCRMFRSFANICSRDSISSIIHTTHPSQHGIHRRVTRRWSLKISGDDRGWQFVAKESEKPVSLSASRVECAESREGKQNSWVFMHDQYLWLVTMVMFFHHLLCLLLQNLPKFHAGPLQWGVATESSVSTHRGSGAWGVEMLRNEWAFP